MRINLGEVEGSRQIKNLAERQLVIISEPSNPWISGVSNLFTDEYFAMEVAVADTYRAIGNPWLAQEFTRRLVAFRNRHPVFRRRRWFQGRRIHGVGVEDIGWFTSDGNEMTPEQWDTGYVKTLGIYLNGNAIENPDERGRRIIDDTFYLLFNSHFDAVDFRLPPPDTAPLATSSSEPSNTGTAATSRL